MSLFRTRPAIQPAYADTSPIQIQNYDARSRYSVFIVGLVTGLGVERHDFQECPNIAHFFSFLDIVRQFGNLDKPAEKQV